MDSTRIYDIIKYTAALLKQEYDYATLSDKQITPREYAIDEVDDFKKDLIDAASSVKVVFLENEMSLEEFPVFLETVQIPILVFEKTADDFAPAVIYRKDNKINIYRFNVESEDIFTSECCNDFLRNENGQVMFMGAFSYKSLVSEEDGDDGHVELSPMKRLFRLLSEEKKDIVNIFIYAVFIGIVSLTLPLGIQATVELVSGGVVVSSIYILIALVIIGILAVGGLQVMQITIVEYIQRRIFTKAALEFAFRVPRIKVEALLQHHAPELMNRFFDVLTLQKGLPKLLIDITSSSMQILFGLILLSFYHPFFVFFGLVLLGILTLIFVLTGPKGLKTSIYESKYKYKVVYWLEEVARTINSFKISGNTTLPMKKTEFNVNNYLKNRKAHFSVLISQYTYIILFKAVITGGLLIIGTILVIQREITLGQFVASEVIIILILNSVEKIILYMEVVYDLLTAVDKISHVTDLPLERIGGYNIPKGQVHGGYSISIKDLKYKFPDKSGLALENVNVSIEAGEKICIAGGNGAGKTTLMNVLAGLVNGYEGIVAINNYSLRDLDLSSLRDKIAKNVSQEDIFDGTILENILVGKPGAHFDDANKAIESVGLLDTINKLPEGMNTHIVSGGKGYSSSFINRLILARCLAKNPHVLILNDYFNAFQRREKAEIIDMLTSSNQPYTLLAVSNDPVIMAACDRVLLMDGGRSIAAAPYDELLKDENYGHLLN